MYACLRVGLYALVVALPMLSAGILVSAYPPASIAQNSPLRAVESLLDRWLLALAPLAPREAAGAATSLQVRVLARSKMSPQVAAMAADGDLRLLRLRVHVDGAQRPFDRTEVAALGGALLSVDVRSGERLVDLPGAALDRFALTPSVQHVALVGVVARTR